MQIITDFPTGDNTGLCIKNDSGFKKINGVIELNHCHNNDIQIFYICEVKPCPVDENTYNCNICGKIISSDKFQKRHEVCCSDCYVLDQE